MGYRRQPDENRAAAGRLRLSGRRADRNRIRFRAERRAAAAGAGTFGVRVGTLGCQSEIRAWPGRQRPERSVCLHQQRRAAARLRALGRRAVLLAIG